MVRISLTPIIDVVFILLIFFMLATNFQSFNKTDIKLSNESASVSQSDKRIYLIEFNKDGEFTLNKQSLSQRKIKAAILESKKNDEEFMVVLKGSKDTDIKDIGKNLEIKNVIKLQAMVNNEMINVYNVPFYKEKLLYTDQLNIFDKPIYQNVTLGSYILNDPIVKSKINIIRIKKQKQKLLNEIEVLRNG